MKVQISANANSKDLQSKQREILSISRGEILNPTKRGEI